MDLGSATKRRTARGAPARSYRATSDDGVAWITGASSGIGQALALRLASQGYRVVVTARRAECLDEMAAGCAGIVSRPGDVTDGAQMRELIGAIESGIGPIVLAVLNAGVYDPSERSGFDAEAAWRTVDCNLGGAIRCAAPVLEAMAARGRGQLALVSSLAGYGGVPGSLAYGASKAALINLAEGLRLTYRRKGVTVQVVNPGFVATAMTARNEYPMPLMMDAATAARRVERGLRRGGFEICFPRRLAWTMKIVGALPYALWLPLMQRATRRVDGTPVKVD